MKLLKLRIPIENKILQTMLHGVATEVVIIIYFNILEQDSRGRKATSTLSFETE